MGRPTGESSGVGGRGELGLGYGGGELHISSPGRNLDQSLELSFPQLQELVLSTKPEPHHGMTATLDRKFLLTRICHQPRLSQSTSPLHIHTICNKI